MGPAGPAPLDTEQPSAGERRAALDRLERMERMVEDRRQGAGGAEQRSVQDALQTAPGKVATSAVMRDLCVIM